VAGWWLVGGWLVAGWWLVSGWLVGRCVAWRLNDEKTFPFGRKAAVWGPRHQRRHRHGIRKRKNINNLRAIRCFSKKLQKLKVIFL